MSVDVLCLRPQADFQRAGALPPPTLRVAFRTPDDTDVPVLLKEVRCLVIPAVGPKLSASLLSRTRVKFIQITGAGTDRLNLEAMKNHGIVVANVPGGSNSAVAEYVVTAASMLLRRFAWASAEIRKGNYAAFRARLVGDNLSGLEGLLVGIVGLGTIGLAVAEAFHGMDCRLCYFDPEPRDRFAADTLGAKSLPLPELLRTADIITLHVPLLAATRGLIGPTQFALMKPGAVLIQASRGGIVDEHALAEHLRTGRLAGAAVDVYSEEPPPPDNPLLHLEGEAAARLLLTPHIAGVTRQSWNFLFRSAWRNVERVLIENQSPLNRVG